MLRDDYIVRLAAQFGRALARILGLSRRKQYPAALAAIEEDLDQLLGLKLDAVLRLSAGQLVAFLTLGGIEASWDKVAFLAAILREAGVIHAAEDRPAESYECYLQALHLLLAVLLREEEVRLPEYAPSVEDITTRLGAFVLPAPTSLALLRYYERTGAYGRAEDALFDALEAEPGNADVIEAGLAFYERLRQQSDAALVAGNLPRDEVEAGLAELFKLRADHSPRPGRWTVVQREQLMRNGEETA